jgi:hypothetical protein
MYHYIVEYWDKEEQRNIRESGLIGADTYSTAAEKLTKYYGDSLYSMELAAWEDILTESEVLDGFVHEVEED